MFGGSQQDAVAAPIENEVSSVQDESSAAVPAPTFVSSFADTMPEQQLDTIVAETPVVTPVAVEEPVVTPVAVEEPVVTPVAVEEPVVTPVAVEEPVVTPVAVETILQAPVVDTSVPAALQETESVPLTIMTVNQEEQQIQASQIPTG
jgi:hypothetical protein